MPFAQAGGMHPTCNPFSVQRFGGEVKIVCHVGTASALGGSR
jgi:hypothetical protein